MKFLGEKTKLLERNKKLSQVLLEKNNFLMDYYQKIGKKKLNPFEILNKKTKLENLKKELLNREKKIQILNEKMQKFLNLCFNKKLIRF